MSKLFKLKEWLTISDAAKHISSAINEPVLEADVLQLALDGHLKISVHLVNGAYARKCAVVDILEVEWDEMPTLDGTGTIKIPKNGRVFQHTNGEILQVQEHVLNISNGVWDLPLCGGERIDVEFRFQQLTDGIEVTAVSLEGIFFCNLAGGMYELQSHFSDNKFFDKSNLKKPFNHNENFHPAGALPEDSVFVVRTSALIEFLQSINEDHKKIDSTLNTRERDTLLKLVIGMAIKGYKYEPFASKSTVTKEIADDLAALDISVSDDTIRKYLKQATNSVLPADVKKSL